VSRKPKSEADSPTPARVTDLDRRWHLAESDHEIAVAEMEYAMIRSYEAFGRWQAECFAAVSGLDMNGGDNAILHVIRMKERSKGIKEIARLMNRDDIPNIQYSIRKLQKSGLIEKHAAASHRKGVSYGVTDRGRQVTDAYAKLRRELLIHLTQAVGNIEDDLRHASRTLDLVSGIYEQAARVAATHRNTQETS